MASAFKRHLEELVHNLCSSLVVYKASRHDEHVGVVMLADEACNLRLPCNSGAHAVVLVKNHAYALSASADTYSGINLAAFDACMTKKNRMLSMKSERGLYKK